MTGLEQKDVECLCWMSFQGPERATGLRHATGTSTRAEQELRLDTEVGTQTRGWLDPKRAGIRKRNGDQNQRSRPETGLSHDLGLELTTCSCGQKLDLPKNGTLFGPAECNKRSIVISCMFRLVFCLWQSSGQRSAVAGSFIVHWIGGSSWRNVQVD